MPDQDQSKMLPDEQRVINERLEQLDDRESNLSLEEVAENAGIEL